MGNCLDSESAHDDISLLRDDIRESNNQPRDPSDHLGQHSFNENVQPNVPVYYPSPNVSRPATEAEQIKIAHRMGLINHLPTGLFDSTGCKKNKECAICMCEFLLDEKIRYLPCMHTYHKDCIDMWLMRSFICPSCLEPVDAALLSSYHQ